MGLYLRQNEDRSKLQERLAAELQEKAKKRAQLENGERPDGISDSDFVKDTKQTSTLAWVWIVLILAALIAFIWLFTKNS